MKIAGRKLTGGTTLAIMAAAVAASLAGYDYVRDGASNEFVDRVSGAVHVERKDDMNGAYEGRLVWISGVPSGSNALKDIDFNLELPLLRLERHSEIFQWEESGSKHRKYSVGWSPRPVDSRDFRYEEGHVNVGSISYPEFVTGPASYKIGPVEIDGSYVSKMPRTKVALTQALYDGMPEAVRSRFALSSDDILVPGEDGQVRELKIGDNRISFDGIRPAPITVVGKYANGTIVPFALGNDAVQVLRMEDTTLDKITSEMRASVASWTHILAWIACSLFGLGVVLFVFDFAKAEIELPPARFGR